MPASQPATRPPVDPRDALEVAPLGSLPAIERLDAEVTRVLAPNPSPMTLDGTNTYVLAVTGSGDAIVVDPGPPDADHLARVEAVLADIDAAASTVLVTHHHVDHAAAAGQWARRWGARVAAASPDVAGPGGRVLTDGDRLDTGGLTVEVVATPGHAGDHLAFRLGNGALLTGDHVLGRGTSVVAHPDGDLGVYLASLRRVLQLGAAPLYPGHGPSLDDDPMAVVAFYLDHRAFRQRQILACLSEGPHTPRQLVARIYADVDAALWPAAEASTRAAANHLVAQGSVRADGDQLALA